MYIQMQEPGMKKTDDFNAKLELWAAENRIIGFPIATGFPEFKCQRFSSGDDMNAWKTELLAETARRGGVKWTN